MRPAKRGKGRAGKESEDQTPEQRHEAMTWAQQKDRLPGGVLPELSWQTRKAVKAGGLFRTFCPPPLRGQLKLFNIAPDDFVNRKSGRLNRLRPDRRIFQAYSAFSSQPCNTGVLRLFSLYLHVDEVLPSYFEIQATMAMIKPTAGWKANTYIIFDYQSETDFKFAGINDSINKLHIGHRDALGWHVDATTQFTATFDTFYNVLLAVHGAAVTLVAEGTTVLEHGFDPRVVDGISYGLNMGMVGFGSDNSCGSFDNIAVQVLPPERTFEHTEDFTDAVADLFTAGQTGDWQITTARYNAAPVAPEDKAVSLLDIGTTIGAAPGEYALSTASVLELEASLNTAIRGGFVFDYYSVDDFKYVAIDAQTDQVIIGH